MMMSDQVLADGMFGGCLTIDLGALVSNYKHLQQCAGQAKVAAVVKADAYGLGAEKVVPALYKAGCRLFFVAQLVEACRLRSFIKDDAVIAVLNDIQPGMEALCADQGFWPVLNGRGSIENWMAYCRQQNTRYPAILQVDTGMSRLGLDDDEVDWLAQSPVLFDVSDIRFIMSHLASSEEPQNPANHMQLAKLKSILVRLPSCPVAFANSGGIYLGADFTFDLVRPGIALYGVDPLGRCQSGLKPVVELMARVVQTRHVAQGVGVGYSGTFVTRRPSIITTIAVGYADGWSRHLSNCGRAYFKGQALPIIGSVSMDSITLDATDIEGETPCQGDFIELLGPHQTLQDVARDAGTIPYEILTSLGRRYDRRYINEEE